MKREGMSSWDNTSLENSLFKTYEAFDVVGKRDEENQERIDYSP